MRAPRGNKLTCGSWLTEAPYRMIQNNLDPEVAEHPDRLVVYGGIGKAARNWEAFDRILSVLTRLKDDESLLVQSGKPVGVFKTHVDAPRVLIANSNLVPHWATWEHFHELDRKGLMMFGQMTAGSWIYIGSQGIVQGTYETFGACAREHFGGNAAGRWILTAGLGGMGGAQPLAATMAGFSMLAVECDESRIDFRLRTRYIDRKATTLDEALAMIEGARRAKQALSVGLLGNAADVVPALVARGVVPDVVTDQTSAHDPRNGYLPRGWTMAKAAEARQKDPALIEREARASMKIHVQAMLDLKAKGAIVFDYGNNIRQVALEEGLKNAFDFPGLRACLRAAALLRGHRAIPLGGALRRSRGHLSHRRKGEGADSGQQASASLARHGARAHPVPGPAGAHLLGRVEGSRAARARVQRDGCEGRTFCAGRDRPRSPRLRLGREPESRDRSDEGRIGRRLRLGFPECAAFHRERRHLGVDPPRRRRRHGILAACRPRDRLRRHGGCCRTHRASFME